MESALIGLSGSEVLHSRRDYGSNKIPVPPTLTFWQKYIENFEDPLIRILCVCVQLVMVLSYYGYASITESFGIFFSILISTSVGTYSEFRSETTFTKLQAENSVTSVLCYRRGLGCSVDEQFSEDTCERLVSRWHEGVLADEAVRHEPCGQGGICVNPSSYKGGETVQKAEDQVELLRLDVGRRMDINFAHSFRVPLSVEDLVVGDLVVQSAGDLVPADGYLISGYLLVNQKSLTGEDVGIPKHPCHRYDPVFPFCPQEVAMSPNNTDDNLDSEYIVFRGGLVEEGAAVMRVMSVGVHTQYSKSMIVSSGEDDDESDENGNSQSIDISIIPQSPSSEYNPYEEELGLTSLATAPSTHRPVEEAPSELRYIKATRSPPLKSKLQSQAEQITQATYWLAAAMAVVFMFKQVWIDHDYNPEAVLGYLQNLALVMHDLLTALMLSVVVLVVSVPEGLPMMIAIVQSLNMRKLLNEHVLVRRLVGIETAGSLSLVCVDKTGTLTAGQFNVRACFDKTGKPLHLSTLIGTLIKASCIDASVTVNVSGTTPASVYTSEKGTTAVGSNSSDRAILCWLVDNIGMSRDVQFTPTTIPITSSTTTNTYDDICSAFSQYVSVTSKQLFTSALKKNKTSISVHKDYLDPAEYTGMESYCTNSNNTCNFHIIKGAAEVLLDQCAYSYDDSTRTVSPFTLHDRASITARFDALSKRGERLIALCLALDSQHEYNLCLVGVFALSDTLRPSTRHSVSILQQANVQVMMITGDRRETAVTIAQEAGVLPHPDGWASVQAWAAGSQYSGASCAEYNALLCYLTARVNVCGPAPCLVLTSAQMRLLSDFELAWFLPYLCVVARALPSDKTRIVRVAQNRHIFLAGLTDPPQPHSAKPTGVLAACLSLLHKLRGHKEMKPAVSAKFKNAREFVHKFHAKFFTVRRGGTTALDPSRYKDAQFWTGVHQHKILPSEMTFEAVFGSAPAGLANSAYLTDAVRVGPPMVVGMVGDGINDSGALKAADVSFAMGSATELTKEAADVVLLDDNLASVVNSVQYGRTIFRNIRLFITFQCTVNLSALCCVILGPLLGFDLPLTLVQLLWVNLVMDSLAALAFGGESSQRQCLQERPFPQNGRIINKPMWRSIVSNGMFIAALSILFLTWDPIVSYFSRTNLVSPDTNNLPSTSIDAAPARDSSPARLHYEGGIVYLTAFFNFFVIANTLHAFNVRSSASMNPLHNLKENGTFVIIMIGIILVQITFTHLPMCNAVLRTTPLQLHEWVAVISMASSVFLFDAARKYFFRDQGDNLESLEMKHVDAAVQQFNSLYTARHKE